MGEAGAAAAGQRCEELREEGVGCTGPRPDPSPPAVPASPPTGLRPVDHPLPQACPLTTSSQCPGRCRCLRGSGPSEHWDGSGNYRVPGGRMGWERGKELSDTPLPAAPPITAPKRPLTPLSSEAPSAPGFPERSRWVRAESKAALEARARPRAFIPGGGGGGGSGSWVKLHQPYPTPSLAPLTSRCQPCLC